MMEKMFGNAEDAFAYKSDSELRNAFWLFRAMGFNRLVSVGTRMILGAIKWKLPVNGMLRRTLYNQFVGGETLGSVTSVIDKLGAYRVDVILDYGAEAKTGEVNFDLTTQEFVKAIDYAASQKNIPFVSLKITALARFGLLEKLNNLVTIHGDKICIDTAMLGEAETAEWMRVTARVSQICDAALHHQIGVLIDAEESWVQNTIDAVTMLAMKAFNQNSVIVFNTIQLYRHDKLAFLKVSYEAANWFGFKLGVKLVRGAYMEKEAARAAADNQPSPIQRNKEATDRDYNKAVCFCMEHLTDMAVVIATHNEFSCFHTTEKMREKRLRPDNAHVCFSQLYGMSDNVTFGLAKKGYRASKYLPYGPVSDVIPYLLRRAQENSSVAGQTGRETGLLAREMKRRGLATF